MNVRTILHAITQLIENASEVGLRPYLPRQNTMQALTTFYSVLAGVFYSDAYAHFAALGFFSKLNLISILSVTFTFIASAMLLIMVWIEIESNIRNKDIFGEDQSRVPQDLRPAISYARTIAAFLCMFVFSIAPLQLAIASNALTAKAIDTVAQAGVLMSFYLYVAFALSSLTFWRTILLITSNHRRAAKKSVSAKTIKTGMQIPLSASLALAYAIRGPITIATKGFLVSIVLPFFTLAVWFGLTWLVVQSVETQRIGVKKGFAFTAIATVLVLMFYAGVFS